MFSGEFKGHEKMRGKQQAREWGGIVGEKGTRREEGKTSTVLYRARGGLGTRWEGESWGLKGGLRLGWGGVVPFPKFFGSIQYFLAD